MDVEPSSFEEAGRRLEERERVKTARDIALLKRAVLQLNTGSKLDKDVFKRLTK